MKLSQQPEFQSKYIGAIDITRDTPVSVIKITREHVDRDDPEKERTVLYFHAHKKGLVLNVTNGKTMIEAFGDETDNWPGAQIVLYKIETNFEGKAGVRIRIPAQTQAGAPPPPAATVPGPPPPTQQPPVEEDDIPF